jgi:hypothetical protein
LFPTTQGQVAFVGGIEIYNRSGRANAVRGYRFWRKGEAGEWIAMESQNYKESSEDKTYLHRNLTPVTLSPYSGVEVKVLAFTTAKPVESMDIRVEVEDLFEKQYYLEVTASYSLATQQSIE